MKNKLLEKIRSKTAVIGIIGLGYVGLPLMLRFTEAGFKTLGFDIAADKTEKLNLGKSYFAHIPTTKIEQSLATGRFEATTDFSRTDDADALIICVPTPLGMHQDPDISFITNTLDALMPYLRPGQVMCLESTTYPGTTEEELRPRIEKCGQVIGENYFLVFSPEREDPGNPQFHTSSIPKVIGGSTPACLEIGLILYGSAIDKVVPVSSTRAAEMTKLLENIYRAVNIGLVNELKIICDRMDIDIWEVVDAAATKPFGFTPFYPGPGLGGHCIPIDPFYLTWKSKEFGINTRFIELAGQINTKMPEWVMGKIIDALNDRKKSLNGSKVLILGIAYKKNIDDMRESPSVELMELLSNKGAVVSYSDPYVPAFPKMRNYHFELESIQLTADVIGIMDCIVIATDHDNFDYALILEHASLIVDTRGKYKGKLNNVVKA